MKGVIIAAGYGTRFLPGTKTIPKEMFPLVNKPAIALILGYPATTFRRTLRRSFSSVTTVTS